MRISQYTAHAGRSAILACWLGLLCACGGGGSSGDAGQGGGGAVNPPAPPPPAPPPPPAVTHALGGSVTGLVGTGLILRNGATDLPIAADGAFTFPVALTDGTAYDVTIAAQPSDPVQVCSIDNGSGAIAGSAVTDILVECVSTYEFLSSSPADGAVETTRAAQPVLTFSADLDAATATPAHVTLTSDAGEQPIDLIVAGSVLTMVPEAKLLPLTEYTISVSLGLLSDAGEVLDSPVTTTFTTRDAEWLPQESLLEPAFGVRKVVSDAQGNTLVFWTEGAGGNRTFWSRYRAEDTGDWSAPMQVAGLADDHPILDLQMVFDSDGTGTIIWKRLEEYGDPIELWTNRHVPGSGWGVATRIDTGSVEVGSFRAAGNGDGGVVMVWQQNVGSTTEMWASHYQPATGWGAPEPIDVFEQLPPLTVLDAEMGLAVDAESNAIVTWQRRENDVYTIPKAFASRYEPGTGWSPAEMLSADLTGFHGRPEVAMDASGNAIAIWRGVSAGAASGVYASQYVRGVGWGEPEVIDAVSTADETPQVAFGPSGEAIAVWPQLQGSVIYASRLDPGSGWGAAEQINTSGLGNAFFPRVAFDASGNALVVWQQLAPTMPLAYNVWSNRYTPTGDWSVAEMIGAAGEWFVEQMPLLRVDPSGDARAIWVEFGTGVIWSAHFE